MTLPVQIPEAIAQRVGAELWPSWGTSEEGRARAAEVVRLVAAGRVPEVHELTVAERDRIHGLLHRELRGTRALVHEHLKAAGVAR